MPAAEWVRLLPDYRYRPGPGEVLSVLNPLLGAVNTTSIGTEG
ncbi:MAG: hypothetical protein WB644_13145 [Candidatus Cybelea sp.]